MKSKKINIIALSLVCAFCLSSCTILNRFSGTDSKGAEQIGTSHTSKPKASHNKTKDDKNGETENQADALTTSTDSIYETQEEIAPSNETMTCLIDSLIFFSKQYLGKPYLASGNGPNAFDCSGFTKFVFGHFGIALNRSSDTQIENGVPVKKQSDIKKGDLVFFCGSKINGKIGHVGLVVDNDVKNHVFSFIHASCSNGVIISKSNESYYASRYISACRVIRDAMPSFSRKDLNKANSTKPDTGKQYYTIKKGDTLTSIAKKHNTTVDKLCKLNKISRESTLRIGQKIRVK